MTANPYLQGNFGPVRVETTEHQVPVTGTIPGHLDGRYLHIGPNPVVDPDPDRYHWFLGTGMVHGLRIRDGRVDWYRNRYVRSAEVAKADGVKPLPGPVHAGWDLSPNTNVIGHARKTFALIEAGPNPYELDGELETVGPCDFDGTLPGGYTAHPLRDPATGELHAVSYYWGWGPKVQYTVLGTNGLIKRVVDIPVSGSPMMHAFSLTERHIVLLDLPVTFDAHKAAADTPGLFARPAEALTRAVVGRRPVPDVVASAVSKSTGNSILPYSWDPKYPARVGVMPRQGTAADVTWFDVEPCYVFHPMNAHDTDTGIVLDVTRHAKMFANEHRGPSEGAPTLDRWTIDFNSRKLTEERLDDRPHEFPRIDERLTGRPTRYGYAVGLDTTLNLATSAEVIKFDLISGDTHVRSFGPGVAVDECVFVPASTGSAEDDGILMGFAYDRATDRSKLIVLDAGSLETVAEAVLPVRVPHGFHGNWIPTGQ